LAKEVVENGGQAIGLPIDAADEGSVDSFFRAAAVEFGRVDGAFINSALTAPEMARADQDALSVPLDVFDRMIAVNLRGHLLCARAALPHVLASGGGGLVFTSSCDAFDGQPTRPAYAMSKAGIHALVRHVASRWGKEGVRANAVAPGIVAVDLAGGQAPGTEEWRQTYLARTRSPRLGKGEDIAASVAYLLSEDGVWVNGQVLGVDGGLLLR